MQENYIVTTEYPGHGIFVSRPKSLAHYFGKKYWETISSIKRAEWRTIDIRV